MTLRELWRNVARVSQHHTDAIAERDAHKRATPAWVEWQIIAERCTREERRLRRKIKTIERMIACEREAHA